MTRTMLLLAAGTLVGVALGLVVFGGLWWTTRRLTDSRRPALLLTASFLLRLVIAAGALVGLARAEPTLLIGALVGVLIARVALIRRIERDGPGSRLGAGVVGRG